MKKLLTMAAALGLSIAASATTRIKTELDWGRKSRDCSGLGVCSSKTTTIDGDGIVILTLSDDGTTLTMDVSAEALSEKSGQISGGKFVQDEDYTFPNDVCVSLGIRGCVTIPAGRYPARLTNGRYTIEFMVTDIPTGTH